MNRRAVLLPFVVMLTAGCGQQVSTVAPSVSAAGSSRDQLIIAESFNGGPMHLAVRDGSTGKLLQRLPSGTPAPDWSRFYWISLQAGSAQLNATDLKTGHVVAHTKIPDGLQFPAFDPAVSAGISPNGKWLALVRQSHEGGVVESDFSVGSSELNKPFQNLRLRGDFTFDAISNDGNSLYLIERLDDQGHYQVRLYNVVPGLLQPFPIVDKREPNEPMNGVRGDSIPAHDGSYVFSVYARAGGPFIHALPLDEAFAWCVDLPGSGSADLEQQFHWSLALSRDGGTLYALNGVTGSIAQLSITSPPGPPAVVRSSQLAVGRPSSLSGLVTDAAAKEAPIGGLTLSPDGLTLYAVAATGIVAIDTASLTVQARFLQGESIPSIRLSGDGRWLYAVVPGAGKVSQVDTKTGVVVHQLTGLDNPWALLWVKTAQ